MSGVESNVPGVVLGIPPPDKEAIEAVDRLRRQFDRSVALWQKKQLRMRQNMIFATIKVVKTWDLAQVCVYKFVAVLTILFNFTSHAHTLFFSSSQWAKNKELPLGEH